MDGNESFGCVGQRPFRVVLTDAQTLCQLKTLQGRQTGERLAHGSYLPAMGTYVSFIF